MNGNIWGDDDDQTGGFGAAPVASPVMDNETRRRLMMQIGLPMMGAQMGGMLLAAAQGGQSPERRAFYMGQAAQAPTTGMEAVAGAERSWREDQRAGQGLAMQRLQMQQLLRRQQREDQISQYLMGGGVPPAGGGSAPPAGGGSGSWRDLLRRAEGGTSEQGAVNGGGFSGRYQMGAPFLSTLGIYTPGQGEDLRNWSAGGGTQRNTTQWTGQFNIPGHEGVRTYADFMRNPAAQEAAMDLAEQHYRRAIAETPGADRLNPNGLMAVAHLGGVEGMRRFVATNGEYNPADGNGTRLSDYYRRFSAAPQGGGQAPPSGGDQYRQQLPPPDVLRSMTNEQRALLARNPTTGLAAVVQAQTRLAGEQPRYAPLTEQQLIGLGMPQQAARQVAGLSTRAEQDQAVRAYATREQPRPSEQEDSLRTQFQAIAPVQRVVQSAPLYESIVSTLDRIRAAQRAGQSDRLADLDVVVALANLYDPGSVVREGEVANVLRTQGLDDRVRSMLSIVTAGQALQPQMLEWIERSAADRMRSYNRAAEPYAREYRALAGRRNLNPENVVMGYGDPVAAREEQRRAAADEEPPPPPAGAPRPPAGATPAEIAGRIRANYPDPVLRRRMAVAAGIDPRLVE